MVYRDDGSSHKNGVANETFFVDFVNTRSVLIRHVVCPPDHTMKQHGGTQSKIDAEVVGPDGSTLYTLTIKNHKKGTFDWVNTTSCDVLTSVKENLEKFRESCVPAPQTAEEARRFRSTFNEIFSRAIRSIENDDALIQSILQRCYEKNPEYLVVNNVNTREFILARTRESTPELGTYENWTYFLKFGRAQTSGQVWRRRGDGEEVNTHLRLRLVSNNGITAFFFKNSVPCLKLQQEHVDGFIQKLYEPVRETWT